MMQRTRLVRCAILGMGIGLPLQVLSLVYAADMSDPAAIGIGMGSLYIGGLAMALCYVSLFALWLHTNFLVGLRARLAAVGRMALTNYLMQSVICTMIFNAYGFGQFGKVHFLPRCTSPQRVTRAA